MPTADSAHPSFPRASAASGEGLRHCWIDVYAGPGFEGERRRCFGPAVLDGTFFGNCDQVSVRIGDDAVLRIERRDGTGEPLDTQQPVEHRGGCMLDAIDVQAARRVLFSIRPRVAA